jgi:hypothetical protein
MIISRNANISCMNLTEEKAHFRHELEGKYISMRRRQVFEGILSELKVQTTVSEFQVASPHPNVVNPMP